MDKKLDFKAFLKGDKKKITIIVIALLGALLMLLSLGDKGEEEVKDCESLSEYKERLEEELSEICSSVSGAGRCKVSVSFSEGERAEYRGTNKISSTPPRILGITVLSEGAERSEVRSALTECMTALFDIGSNRVAVLKMK